MKSRTLFLVILALLPACSTVRLPYIGVGARQNDRAAPADPLIGAPVITLTATEILSPTASVTSPAEPLPSPPPTATQDFQERLVEAVQASLLPTEIPAASGESMFPGIDRVGVLPLEGTNGARSRWAVYTLGARRYEPLQNHFVGIYRLDGGLLHMLSRIELENPDVVADGGLLRLQVAGEDLWLALSSGSGAHSACFDLLHLAGDVLERVLSHCNSSGQAGEAVDLDGDGSVEIMLDTSNAYVFCYACGLRIANVQIYRFEKSSLGPVKLTELGEQDPEDVRSLNQRAIQLAGADLWKDASLVIELARQSAPEDSRIAWNARLIQLIENRRIQEAQNSSYPLLASVFAGDYAAAIDLFRPYKFNQIFSQSHSVLVAGTVAEGYQEKLIQLLADFTNRAIAAQPDLAAAYFLRGWATYLQDPEDWRSMGDIRRAAELAPGDPFYASAERYLFGK